MRPVNNKRPRGRSTGRRTHGPNRSYESNGPDLKIRGTASQVYEKYCALARDSVSNGDFVASENYQQHAEHYFRIMAVITEQSANRGPQRPNGANGAHEFAAPEPDNRSGTDRDAAPAAVDPGDLEQPPTGIVAPVE